MRFTGTITTVDLSEMKKTWNETLEVELRHAARAWLKAILTAKLPSIKPGRPASEGVPPVWTGTARGSLMPLGRFLRIKVDVKPIAWRSGRGPTVGSNKSKFEFVNTPGRYHFRFSTQLAYMVFNEFNQSNLKLTYKTPWGMMKIGQAAFKDYCDTVMPDKMQKALQGKIRYKTRVTR